MIFYIEFGAVDVHNHNGIDLNRDTLGVVYAENERQAEWYATRNFGYEWLFIYPEDLTDNLFLEQFSGGLKVLNPEIVRKRR